jgi:hypothetical protein
MALELGRLQRVDLRQAWLTEAGHFTPWLATPDNIVELGTTIGMVLEVEAQEKDVGPFRADILCKNTLDDSWVLIENQLERTDHTHLGQLITYAAGLEAVTVVWVSARFTEEHRAALDWLNRITDERFNFFGLEVELWQIGNSPVAPKFNVVSQPNNWSKRVLEAKGAVGTSSLSEGKQLQLEYFTAFDAFLDAVGCKLGHVKPLPQGWMSFALGRTGFRLCAIASLYDSLADTYDGNEIRVELIVESKPDAKPYFAALQAQQPILEEQLGEALTWHSRPDANMCRVYVRRSAGLRNRADWASQHEWLRSKLERMHAVFGPVVRALQPAAVV